MRANPVPNQGSRSYPPNRSRHRNVFRPSGFLNRRGLDLDADKVRGTGSPPSCYGHSRGEMSSHLGPSPFALQLDARSTSLEVGLLGTGQTTGEGETKSLFARRNYSLCLPLRYGRRRHTGCGLRIGALHLRPKPIRGKRAISANADSLAGKL
jgi:hypothetical protein